MISYLLLQYHVDHDIFVTVTNLLYNSFVVLAVATGLFLVYRKMLAIGYERARLLKFFAIIALFILPAGYASSRAANIFYHPPQMWSFGLLWDIITSNTYHTFHASIMLPAFLIIILLFIMKFRYWDVSDAFFLYIPLSNAIGRVACFLMGCCWGGPISLSLFGHPLSFYNPVPLYEIAYNIAIFLVLRKMHARIYTSGDAGARSAEGGRITALYLILYGDIRFIMEFMRTEEILAWGLTQAQLVMIGFVAIGLAILAGTALWSRLRSLNEEERARKLRYAYPAGLAVYFFIIFGLAAFLIRAGIVRWPLFPVDTVKEIYGRIPVYLPVFFLESAALWVLWRLRISIIPSFTFRWKNPLAPVFILGLAGSAAYSAVLFSVTTYSIRGAAFWPPVVIFSILNAFAEEVFFRLVLYRLLRYAGAGAPASNASQAALYSIIHLAVGGPLFAVYSLVYGGILCLIYEKTESIIPPMICHFIIDIGVIGLPLLQYCPCWYK